MAPLPVLTSLGSWSVDGTPMLCPAWSVLNIQTLWQGPSVVLSNRLQAGGVGRKPYPGMPDETKLSVRFHIIGDCELDGTPNADPQAGFIVNYFYLRDNVIDAVDPVRTSTLVIPGVGTRTAKVQFDPLPLPDGYVKEMTVTLGVTLAEGSHA